MKNVFDYLKNQTGIACVVLTLFAFSHATAQVSFKPGLRAGANFSHFTKGDYGYNNTYYYEFNGNYVPYNNGNIEFGTKTDFYIGFYGALKLTKYYTLQPEITYSNQGATYTPRYVPAAYPNDPYYFNFPKRLNVSYLSVAMINKFNFNRQFNMHVGPAIDFVVDKNYPVENDIDLAFVLGAGYDITPNFGIEARVKKGIVPAVNDNYSGDDHTNVVFSVGATYTFNVK